MANYATLKAAIADVVKTNGSQAITGDNLQQVLLSIVNSIGGGYLFKGVATPSTGVGTPDQNVFYIGGAGTYGNFGGTAYTVPLGSIGVFMYNGSWTNGYINIYNNGALNILGYYDISANNRGTAYASLSTALEAVPPAFRKGGMTIKYIDETSGKYVQYRLMSSTWNTTESNWQGISDTPSTDSSNLITGSGIYDLIKKSGRGYIIERDHVYSYYGFEDSRNIYYNNASWDAIWIIIPERATKLNVTGCVVNGGPFYFSGFEIVNDNQVFHKNYLGNNQTSSILGDGKWFIPEFVGQARPIVALINLKKDDNPNIDYESINIWFDYVDEVSHNEVSLNGKKVSVIGSSNSTFSTYTYWDNSGTIIAENRYPANPSYAVNNVASVHQIWWKKILDRCGAVLERANCVGSSSISTNNLYNSYSYLLRYVDIGSPDVIFIEGFMNEPANASATFNPRISTANLDTADVGQAYDKLIRLLQSTYPAARIINVVFPVVRQSFKDISREIDKYYGIEHIEFIAGNIDYSTITSDNVHPNAEGMARIADFIISKIDNINIEGDNHKLLYDIRDHLDSASPYNDPDVLKYITDEELAIVAIVYKDGRIVRMAKTEQDILLEHISSPSPYSGPDVLKYLTDDNGHCFGYIRKDGTVFLYKAEIMDLTGRGDEDAASAKKVASVISLLGTGMDNIQMSNNPKFMNTLHNLFESGDIELNGKDNMNARNLRPLISIIDDDTIDYQIPSSTGETVATTNTGGYFSVLLPMMLSLGAKYGKTIPVGLACEGQRVGLTHLRSSDDSYTTLNENGNAVKWLHDNMGWNVFNHSMTAQLPLQAYYVDGIDSELADQILSEYTGSYYVPYSFGNLVVLDRLTGKWYEVNNQSQSAWVERTPTKKYAMPFYRDYTTRALHFNRDFDFEYSWGEWGKRATELGLPFEKVIVHNGGTSSVYMCYAGRKYAYWSVRTQGIHNYPPIPAMVSRMDAVTGDTNAKSQNYEGRLKSEISNCKASNTWMVLMTHANEQTQYRNYYLDGVTYPDADPDYNREWVIPLKHSEIQDIIGDNVNDYINHPPQRLGIGSWSEWTPIAGTQLKTLYDVLDYALSNGIDIVAPTKGWEIFGNVLNIGVDRNGQRNPYDVAEQQTPYTADEKSYLTIGADMSIRYHNGL